MNNNEIFGSAPATNTGSAKSTTDNATANATATGSNTATGGNEDDIAVVDLDPDNFSMLTHNSSYYYVLITHDYDYPVMMG